jgi:hypothetical protein
MLTRTYVGGVDRRKTRSHVVESDRLAQASQWFACGNEFLADVPGIFDLHQFSHNRPILDLLGIIQLATAGVARGRDVADDVLGLFDPADHVAVLEAERGIRAAWPRDVPFALSQKPEVFSLGSDRQRKPAALADLRAARLLADSGVRIARAAV